MQASFCRALSAPAASIGARRAERVVSCIRSGCMMSARRSGAAVFPARAAHTAAPISGAPRLGQGQFTHTPVRVAIRPSPTRGPRSLTFRTMSLKAGIVGLPNVGKSTLFNAMVENSKAESANYPFCTIEPNVGIVPVPDPRVDVLAELGKSKKKVGTTVEFVDIAGLVKGASEGEGLGNKFLSHIRELVQVVRCFEDENIIHVSGQVNPLEDIDVINTELALSDLGQIERRLDRLKKDLNSHQVDVKRAAGIEDEALKRIQVALEEGRPARSEKLTEEEEPLVRGLCLLTAKPIIYAANVAEEDLADAGAGNVHVKTLRERAAEETAEVIVVSAQVEAELSELDASDKADYLTELGVEEGGLNTLIRSAYATLGLRTYFTCGEQETRAWTIRAGMTAPQAAGVIHSDFERGFIRAETISYSDFTDKGDMGKAKDAGLVRQEGKEYIVAEGDVMLFRFNV